MGWICAAIKRIMTASNHEDHILERLRQVDTSLGKHSQELKNVQQQLDPLKDLLNSMEENFHRGVK